MIVLHLFATPAAMLAFGIMPLKITHTSVIK